VALSYRAASLVALALSAVFAAYAQASDREPLDLEAPKEIGIGVNDYGVGGILDIPSARMPEEGTLTTTYSTKDAADIYAIGYQLTPRLEASFRYTMTDFRRASGRGGSRGAFGDRSFEVKYRLLDEGPLLPEISVGIRDLIGNEVFGAEYVVGSKSFGALDLTLGVGWGVLANRPIAQNPLTWISSTFESRAGPQLRADGAQAGGQFLASSWFRGADIGLFGGLRYSLPRWKLDLLAAYNGDTYDFAVGIGAITDPKPFSVGAEWYGVPGLRLAASWQQGNQLALKFSASVDTLEAPRRKRPNAFGADPGVTAPVRNLDEAVGWWPRFVNDAEASGILVFDAQIDNEKTLILRYRNNAYRLEADALRRIFTLAEIYAPATVTQVIATGSVTDYATHSVRYERPGLDVPPVLLNPDRIEIGAAVPVTRQDFTTRFKYPNTKFTIGAGPRVYLFDPEFPLLYQISARFGGEVDFGGGLRLTGSWTQDLASQFDRISRESDSQLPQVRTQQRNYLQQGKSGIDNLVLTKRGQLRSDVYYQAFGGLLEEMYAGVGGEALWRPYDSRFALGVSVQAVKQREFDKRFGLRDFQTVTGHVSGYWATPFYNFDVSVHAGRYLAGDIGATLEIQKRMANGWILGAWATLTDVPFEVFGEGSFDKGMFFAVPLDVFSTSNTRDVYRTNIRLINRDGGRPVEGAVRSLWDQLRDTQIDRLEDYRGRMMPE